MSILDDTPSLRIGSFHYELEVADTVDERIVGLSNRPGLDSDGGMLFVFETEGRPGIWMKETLVPLDILWTDSEGKIVTIYEDVQPDTYPRVFEPSEDSLYIIELSAGQVRLSGVDVGDEIKISEYVLKLSSEN